METLKQSEIKQYIDDLENITERLKNEIKVQKILGEFNESNAKYLRMQNEKYINPKSFYNFKINGKEICIDRAKYKYFENLGKYGKAKIWTYNIKTLNFQPKCFNTEKHKIYFNSEIQSYGAFKSLITAEYYFKICVLELIEAMKYDNLIKKLFEEEDLKTENEWNDRKKIYQEKTKGAGIEIIDRTPLIFKYNNNSSSSSDSGNCGKLSKPLYNNDLEKKTLWINCGKNVEKSECKDIYKCNGNNDTKLLYEIKNKKNRLRAEFIKYTLKRIIYHSNKWLKKFGD